MCSGPGYYGAVAWVDHLVGELLRELEALGQANDTVVRDLASVLRPLSVALCLRSGCLCPQPPC